MAIGSWDFYINKDLDLAGPNGAAVRRYLKKRNLLAQDLYYLPDAKKYVKESRDMYSSFCKAHLPWKDHAVITDGSTVFTKDGENLFEDVGFTAAAKLNSASHGMLSINDGVLHKIAKAQWQSLSYEGQPQWQRTLDLAYCIVTVDRTMVARKWDEHFQLDLQPSMERLEKVLFPKEDKAPKRKKFHKDCKRKYEAWVDANGEPTVIQVPKDLQSNLDGKQWHQKRKLKK